MGGGFNKARPPLSLCATNNGSSGPVESTRQEENYILKIGHSPIESSCLFSRLRAHQRWRRACVIHPDGLADGLMSSLCRSDARHCWIRLNESTLHTDSSCRGGSSVLGLSDLRKTVNLYCNFFYLRQIHTKTVLAHVYNITFVFKHMIPVVAIFGLRNFHVCLFFVSSYYNYIIWRT